MKPLHEKAIIVATIAWLALALVGGCERSAANRPDKPVVFVTLAPQKFLVDRIAGDRINVRVLVSQGASEHQYDPTPQQMVTLSEAAAYFRIGVSSETRVIEQLRQIAPRLRIVDTRAGIELRTMTHDEGHCDSDHDHEGHAAHAPSPTHGDPYAGKDPHIWLDPHLAIQQATTIQQALCTIDPAGESHYTANLAGLAGDLRALDERLRDLLKPNQGRDFLVHHPSYGYFADRYGLHQIAVETEGKEPTPKALQELIERARKSRTRTIFYQPQFSDRPALAIAKAIDGDAVALDPLSPDYLRNLEAMGQAIARALSAFDKDSAASFPASRPALLTEGAAR